MDREVEQARKENVIRYAARVSEGLSIFGNAGDSQDNMGSIAM
jgi:hypothetical protein